MNTLIKFFAIILFSSSLLMANNKPTEGSSLQVLAPSGLKLRATPSMDASVITVMPHGAEVFLIEFEESTKMTRVDWIDGKWMKVDYNGTVGWAFDGFLTILNVPNHDLEKCYGDLDLLYPVEYWARANFGAEDIDTITDEITFHKTIYSLVNDQKLVVLEENESARLDLYLEDVRVMEVYQLLESMVATRAGKRIFKDSSIFIEKDGTIKKVKIDINSGIEIREIYDGRVRVTIQTYQGC